MKSLIPLIPGELLEGVPHSSDLLGLNSSRHHGGPSIESGGSGNCALPRGVDGVSITDYGFVSDEVYLRLGLELFDDRFETSESCIP